MWTIIACRTCAVLAGLGGLIRAQDASVKPEYAFAAQLAYVLHVCITFGDVDQAQLRDWSYWISRMHRLAPARPPVPIRASPDTSWPTKALLYVTCRSFHK